MSQALQKVQVQSQTQLQTAQPQCLSLSDVFSLGEVFAQSGLFADTKQAAQCIVKILAGKELGVGAFFAMKDIYIIKGKLSLSAHLMANLIKRSKKYNYKVVKLDKEGCIIHFFENTELAGVSEFTKQDAIDAGLMAQSDVWKKYPRNMYFARAMSNGAKFYCAEVFGGSVYTPEELGASVDDKGNVISILDAESSQVEDKQTIAPTEQTKALTSPSKREKLLNRLAIRITEAEKIGCYLDDVKRTNLDELSEEKLNALGLSLKERIKQARNQLVI